MTMKYAACTGKLNAMCKFLVDDLETALELLDADEYTKGRLQISVRHGRETLAEVAKLLDNEQ